MAHWGLLRQKKLYLYKGTEMASQESVKLRNIYKHVNCNIYISYFNPAYAV